LKQILHSPVSWAIVGVILTVQMLVAIGGGPDSLSWWFETLGLSRGGFLSGQVWQVFSYGWLHGGWWHAGLNALFVLVIGSRIELMAGRSAMLKASIAGVVAGGLGHLILGSGLLVGFSGGCLALLLLLTTLSPDSRMFPLPVSGRSLGLGLLIAEFVLALLDPALALPGFAWIGKALIAKGLGFWFELGHACHLGGGLAGWAFGRWLLRPRVSLDRLRRERARREAG
jgi:membrane associated rhomboid family serine protease